MAIAALYEFFEPSERRIVGKAWFCPPYLIFNFPYKIYRVFARKYLVLPTEMQKQQNLK